nr:hypothetical protein [Snodgrassella sp. CFCC 13594]
MIASALGLGVFTAAWADTAAAPLVEQGFVADLSGDYAQARAYYEQAAKQGDAEAHTCWACCIGMAKVLRKTMAKHVRIMSRRLSRAMPWPVRHCK